jgi:hypothetical protein
MARKIGERLLRYGAGGSAGIAVAFLTHAGEITRDMGAGPTQTGGAVGTLTGGLVMGLIATGLIRYAVGQKKQS